MLYFIRISIVDDSLEEILYLSKFEPFRLCKIKKSNYRYNKYMGNNCCALSKKNTKGKGGVRIRYDNVNPRKKSILAQSEL